jgi:hypothetical protein
VIIQSGPRFWSVKVVVDVASWVPPAPLSRTVNDVSATTVAVSPLIAMFVGWTLTW